MSKVTFGCTLASSSLVFWLSFANILFLLSYWGRWSILPAAPMYLCRAIRAGSSCKEHHHCPKAWLPARAGKGRESFLSFFSEIWKLDHQRLNNLEVDGFQLNQFEQKWVTNLFASLETPLDGHRGGGGTCWFLRGEKGGGDLELSGKAMYYPLVAAPVCNWLRGLLWTFVCH